MIKKTFLFGFCLLILIFSYFYFSKNDKSNSKIKKAEEQTSDRLVENAKILNKIIEKDNKYNSQVAFLIDMRIPSNKNRFFVYSLKDNKITDKGLVAHGVGSQTDIPNKLVFSNVENSLSTSLGTYSIGYSYKGQFGKAYKLTGLDATNSNAFLRNIVLHKYADVPYEETKNPICLSYGCPMVNEKFYSRLEKIIDNSSKKILLRIYY